MNLTINRDILEASRKYIPNLSDFVEKKLLEFLQFVNRPLGVEWSSPAGAIDVKNQ
ncbi:hypothetical protein [Geoglobus sp.]